MANGRKRSAPGRAYTQKTLMRDREYGFYWYAWLWKIARPVLVFLCSAIIVAGVMVTGWDYLDRQFVQPVDPTDQTVREFTIERGSSITQIGSDLYEQRFLRNKGIFKYIVQFQGLTNDIQYGSYPLSSSMDVNTIIGILTSGSATNERTITIIPGWTVESIANYLVKIGALEQTDEFLKLANDFDAYKDDSYALQQVEEAGTRDGRKYALEGYLAPDTYRVYMNASADTILRTLIKQMDAVLDDVFTAPAIEDVQYNEYGEIVNADGEVIEEEIPFETTLSRDQTIILASLIEKEAGRARDYAKISAVFHNRLEAGMKLESDATVSYITGATRILLTGDELATDSPYNTYLYAGLPPGPICNPSRAAMKAALYPDTDYVYEDYLYFCAGDPSKGETVFSRTRTEHEANVARYKPLWKSYDQANNANRP
ncbi:MAG: endolytic transglycosylase MltG [Christensenellales bacterium]|jgi:UPF0755 protein